MLKVSAGEKSLHILLTKGEAAVSCDRAQISRQDGQVLEVEFEPHGEDLTILFVRFAVEQYCGLRGVLFQIGQGQDLANLEPSNETLESEIVVKVLMDARVSHELSPSAIRDTALLLLREMQPPKSLGASSVREGPMLSTAKVASCLVFVERSLRRWEALTAGQTFVLELDA